MPLRLLLPTFAFLLSPFAPSAQAYEWQNSGIWESALAERGFDSGPSWYSAGPAWLMNAMPGSHFAVRQYVIDFAVDRQESTSNYNGYVGTSQSTPETPNWNWGALGYANYRPAAGSTSMMAPPLSISAGVNLAAGLTPVGQGSTINPTLPSSGGGLIINYDFTTNVTVPDNGQTTQTKILGGLSGLSTFTNVDVRLNLTTSNVADPMFLGDMYSTLTFGSTLAGETTRTAVLLNRPGRDDTNAFGSSLSSLNVTLSDSAAHTNVWATTSSTGTYNSDGRLGVDPHAAGVPFSNGDRNNTLASLNGAPFPSNRVVLLVADTDPGGTATLSGWGISVTGTAASTGTFTPGAGATLSDTGSGAVNNVGATLNTTGADGGSLLMNFAGTTTFSGGITGTSGITQTGAGTLILSAAGTYTGNTTVTAGTFLVTNATGSATGSGNVTINGSGTLLGGSGIITGSVTLGNTTPGAIVNPGPVGANGAAGSVGTLTVGALTLTGSNTLHIDASGILTSNWDKLVANGVTLGTTSILQLSIASGLSFAPGLQYTLIDNTSLSAISGTFSGITEGGTYTFDGYQFMASYVGGNGNDLVFTAVPEANTWIAAALTLGAIAFLSLPRMLSGQRRRMVRRFRSP